MHRRTQALVLSALLVVSAAVVAGCSEASTSASHTVAYARLCTVSEIKQLSSEIVDIDVEPIDNPLPYPLSVAVAKEQDVVCAANAAVTRDQTTNAIASDVVILSSPLAAVGKRFDAAIVANGGILGTRSDSGEWQWSVDSQVVMFAESLSKRRTFVTAAPN
ncbi:MAG: hypothetical protein JWR36_1850 [Glaciihabitans sp.]|nr:hypothetical protein [Glaciihabitans sp.]